MHFVIETDGVDGVHGFQQFHQRKKVRVRREEGARSRHRGIVLVGEKCKNLIGRLR